MQLFYAPLIDDNEYTLPKEESKHAIRVLRKNVGDIISIVNGKGTLYKAQIISTDNFTCQTRIVEQIDNFARLPYNLTMGVAPTKNIDRYEYFLEKATEIGFSHLVPLCCDHSERRVVKGDRLVRIALEAMKQSEKAAVPVCDEITAFRDFVKSDFGMAQKFIAHCEENESKHHLKDLVQKSSDVVILIGPEGDFSEEEVSFAKTCGFEEISLGESRLRTETAALFAVAIISLINS